jgi:hypothetical protein
VPQYVEVDPHQPYCEQQFPNAEPWQVVVTPQEASVLTVRLTAGLVEVLVLEVDVDVLRDVEVLVVLDELPQSADAEPAERYQLATGSPRQVPVVTEVP